MQVKELNGVYLIRLEMGEKMPSALAEWLEAQGIEGGFFQGIGAFSSAEVGYFDFGGKTYLRIPVPEQVEVLSLLGNVAVGEEGNLVLHTHVVLGKSDGQTLGGHLFEGVVKPTLEVVLIPFGERIRRRKDSASGLQLLALGG